MRSIIQVMDKINKYKKTSSPEQVHELYLHVANGYIDTHHLRVTWLELLSETFLQEGHYAEVAICKLHIAAIIGEFLSHQVSLPIDFSIFSKVSPSLCEIAVMTKKKNFSFNIYLNLKNWIIFKDDEGFESSYLYSEKGFIEKVKNAIYFFEKEDMFEIAVQLYNLIIPILEKENSIIELSYCHKMMASLYDRIIKMVNLNIEF